MRFLFLITSASLGLACASSDLGPAAKGAPRDVCASSAAAARDRVVAVANENLTCASDADCVTVNVGATCFDACSRSVNVTGKGAVDRVSALVEAGECKPFGEDHCTLVSPPCAPPSPPRCNAGKCE